MRVIYIAGPYRGRRLVNILRARAAALFVWQHGGVALCPHMNTAFFDGKMPEAVWLEGDLELLSRCDAVWALPGWRESDGAAMEVARAEALHLPRLESREEVVMFLGEGAPGGR
jgi:hypothetical protein